MSIPYPGGSRLSAATNVLIDVTGTEDVTVFTGRTVPTHGAVPVVYCHGFGVDGEDDVWLDNDRAADDLRPIAAWGHPVFVPNLAGTSTWGNQASIDAVDAVLTWAANAYGTRTDYVAVAAESMGALTALNWAARNPTKVAAVWLRVPCLGLEWTHDNVAAFEGAIDGAYTNHAGYLAALAADPSFDPMRNVATIRRFRNRCRIWATADDEIFPLATTAELAGQLGIQLDVIGGDHAGGYDTPPYVVAQWIDQTIRT